MTQLITPPVEITTDVEAAVLAYTQRQLDAAWDAFDAGGGQATDPTTEAAVFDQTYYTFKCPACPIHMQVIPRRPRLRQGPGLLGFAEIVHPEPFTCSAEKYSHNLTNATVAVKKVREELDTRRGVDLELVRLKRLLAGGEVKWLIPDVMERGMMAALYGPAGTGKSLLALEWAVKLAQGGQRVVYLDEENPPELMDERLEAMSVDPAELTHNLTYYSFTGWTVDTEEGAAKILEACQRARLVVFDSWNKFFASGSQSGDTGALDAYRLTVKPLRAAGVGVLRLDHTGHAEVTRPAGSHVKLGDVDHNWQMKAKDLGDGRAAVTLVHQKSRTGRGPDVLELVRESDPVLRHASAKDRVPAVDLAAPTDAVERLVALMDEKGYATDWSVRKAGAALREAGVKVSQDDLAEAVRRRKAAPVPAAREG
ncbi:MULTISPECIES: AAA family ATPase [Micromonospora]|uniref:AAA family ATPase n=1 Tax=Micromonospora TaxID=1873 RepID=UPI0007DB1469|nr:MULTISPECIES: AAA family ATPase [Micromonospora]